MPRVHLKTLNNHRSKNMSPARDNVFYVLILNFSCPRNPKRIPAEFQKLVVEVLRTLLPENSFAKLSPYLHFHTPPHLKNIVAECGAFPALLLLQKHHALRGGASARGERLVDILTNFC